MQDCSISIANALEMLQSYNESSIWAVYHENYARDLHFVLTLVCWRLVPFDFTDILQGYEVVATP